MGRGKQRGHKAAVLSAGNKGAITPEMEGERKEGDSRRGCGLVEEGSVED